MRRARQPHREIENMLAAEPEIRSFIGEGAIKVGAGPALPVINPATEKVIAIVREAGADEVDLAVSAARAAFDDGGWRRTSVAARQDVLLRLRDLIFKHASELAHLECANTGLPLAQIKGLMLPRAAQNFAFFSEYIGQRAEHLYRQETGFLTLMTRDATGVAALISPWNAPIALTTMKIAGCIAFGNSCVVKPSEQTPSPIARLMELILEAGVPPGVVNMVNGSGATTGRALVDHPGVDMVSFTGGTETGRAIMAAAAGGPKRVTMELGGKSANIVFGDADFDRAIDGSVLAIFAANGEACLAGSRILVQEAIAPRFIEALVARARAIRIGDPLDLATELGPLSMERHMRRVLSYVDTARRRGGADPARRRPRQWLRARVLYRPDRGACAVERFADLPGGDLRAVRQRADVP
jgi:acyl-CoA reductase-like NAD-dependent aldehyde dehydrogenase